MTPAAELVQHKLGRHLPTYLDQLRQSLSWRQVAERISEEAGISVSHETARSWHARYCEQEAA
jgi:transposase-like protein